MDIKNLSLTDLKAAWDFVKYDLQELEKDAKQKNINLDEIPSYNEVKDVENKLYHELLNSTRNLK